MKQEQLDSCPQITPRLKLVNGGIALAIKSMRLTDCEGELIAQFLAKYDAIPERDRKSLSIEAIAISAGINIRHLWGEIMMAITENSAFNSKLIAVAAHPEIIQKRIEYAKTPGGYRDRDKLDEMLGAIKPVGTTFINKFFAGGAETEEEEAPAPQVEMVDDLDFVFPDCEVMQEKVQPMKQRLLESPSTAKR